MDEVVDQKIEDLPEGWKCYLVTATGDEPLGYLFSILKELGISTEGESRPDDVGYLKDTDGIGENSIYITHMETEKEKEENMIKATHRLCRNFITEKKIDEVMKESIERIRQVEGIEWEEVEELERTTHEENPHCTVISYVLDGEKAESNTEVAVLFSISATSDGDLLLHASLDIKDLISKEDLVKEGKCRKLEETSTTSFFSTWSVDTIGLHPKAKEFEEVVTPASVSAYIDAARDKFLNVLTNYLNTGEVPKSTDETYTTYFNLRLK